MISDIDRIKMLLYSMIESEIQNRNMIAETWEAQHQRMPRDIETCHNYMVELARQLEAEQIRDRLFEILRNFS
ncbi:MAG: hypothetical protein IKN72_06105 [Clostridia bacterium]|nr:hypothetical protein [Clostridia bacterium]